MIMIAWQYPTVIQAVILLENATRLLLELTVVSHLLPWKCLRKVSCACKLAMSLCLLCAPHNNELVFGVCLTRTSPSTYLSTAAGTSLYTLWSSYQISEHHNISDWQLKQTVTCTEMGICSFDSNVRKVHEALVKVIIYSSSGYYDV